MLYTFLPLKLRVSGQKGRKLFWKEEIWHPTRETDNTKYHRGRQHNYPYHSPRPEAMTRGNKPLQRGWHHVRYKELQQMILVRLWFIYGDPQHFKKKSPNSKKAMAKHIDKWNQARSQVLNLDEQFFRAHEWIGGRELPLCLWMFSILMCMKWMLSYLSSD